MSSGVIDGRYELLRLIGAGGMGEVWLAQDRQTGDRCAVKLLGHQAGKEPMTRQRFQREAQILSRLRHPNLVAMHDCGLDGDRLYLVMDLVDGSDLAHLVQSGGPLRPDDAIRLILDVLEGLAFAHDHSVIHRDVKPQNVLVGADGRARVGDFGIARVLDGPDTTFTRSGAFLGSPSYMAPEQREDARHVGVEADIYGAGATLYFLLTGRAGAQLHVREVQEEMARTLSPALAAVILKATRFRPSDRYGSARDMAAALRTLSQSAAWSAPPSGVVPPSGSETFQEVIPGHVIPSSVTATATGAHTSWPPRDARSPLAWGAAAGVLLGLGGALFYLLASVPEPPTRPEQAAEASAEEPTAPVTAAPRPAGPIQTGALHIEVRPSGRIVVDGQSEGASPAELHLAVGSHSAELISPSGESVTLTARITTGAPQRLCWDFATHRPCAAEAR